MPTSIENVKTRDGNLTTTVVTPDGAGPWPAVIVCFDAAGVREAMVDMAQRIAKSGYLVVVPDFFYRSGSVFDLLPPDAPKTMAALGAIFGDQEKRAAFFQRFYGPAVDYANLETDVGALLDFLGQRSDVKGKVGITGYCLGGNMAFRAATIFGDRLAAAASFHGGGLVTATPDSPHLRVDKIKARMYIAGAIEDQSFTDENKAELIAAFDKAHVDGKVETYQGHHGFAVPDHSTFDAAAAERHYQALDTLFGATLR